MKYIYTITILFQLFYWSSDLKAQCPISKYGLIPVWPQGWTNADKNNWYQLMRSKGNGLTQLNFTWAEADSIINAGQLSTYVNYISILKAAYDLKFHLSIKNPSTGVNYVPPAYAGMNFEDTVFTNAYFQFAKTLINSFANVTDYLSVGVEADIYFNNHPNELAGFADLFNNISNYVDASHPNIKISSAVTFENGIVLNDTLWQLTKKYSDNLCITYWPINNDFTVKSTAVSDIASNINTLIQKSETKPIIIKECGFPSSTITNSSDSMQADFLKEMFLQTMNKSEIEGLEWQFLADFDSATVNYWVNFYQYNTPEFIGYISSLGFMDTLGTAKPVYNIFLQMMDSVCSVTDIDQNEIYNFPDEFKLFQNYPNPFNPGTTISWQSPVGSYLTIKIFDVLGKELDTIVDGYYEAGSHSASYIVNPALPSGVYFYQLKISDQSIKSSQNLISKKMILIR